MPIVTLGGSAGPSPEQGLLATPTVEVLAVVTADCTPLCAVYATGEVVLIDGLPRPLYARASAVSASTLPVSGIVSALPALERATVVQLGTVLWPTPSLVPGVTYCVGPDGSLVPQRDLIAARAAHRGLFVQPVGRALARDRIQIAPAPPPLQRLP